MSIITQTRIRLNTKAVLDSQFSSFNALIVSTHKTPIIIRPSSRAKPSKGRAKVGHIQGNFGQGEDHYTAHYNDARVAAAFGLKNNGDKKYYEIVADQATRGNFSIKEVPFPSVEMGLEVELVETELVEEPVAKEAVAI